MSAARLRAHVTDQELTLRQRARTGARRTLPDPAATARALALAICEVEAGLRSASQLERICHPSLWAAVANRIERVGGPPVSAASDLRVQVQELTPGWWMRRRGYGTCGSAHQCLDGVSRRRAAASGAGGGAGR